MAQQFLAENASQTALSALLPLPLIFFDLAFFEGGGWGFLDPNSDDEAGEGDPDDLEDSEDEEFKVRNLFEKSCHEEFDCL